MSELRPDIKKCPVCGAPVLNMHGCNWDYDRVICSRRDCDWEIELDTTTTYSASFDKEAIQ